MDTTNELGVAGEIKKATAPTVTKGKETMQTPSYRQQVALSKHRVELKPMSALEFMHVYTRHQLGRQTLEDRSRFVYTTDMTPAQFHDRNGIEIVEPVYEVAINMASSLSRALS